ncbi:MAG: lanthionine synthetase LanC family protein [Halobaculum sp.]
MPESPRENAITMSSVEKINGRLTREAAIREAVSIHDELREAAVGDDGVGWIRIQPNSRERTLVTGDRGIYGGEIGIALYAAALWQETGRESAARTAHRTVEPYLNPTLQNFQKSIRLGVADGVGSLLYGLVTCGQLLGDDRYIETARSLVPLVTDDRLRADEYHDVMFGAAGCLLGLLRLYELTDDEAVLDCARRCGDRLLSDRTPSEPGERVWSIPDRRPMAGFSHGQAGTAMALDRLAGATDEPQYERAAVEAITFENRLYDDEVGKWQDRRPDTPEFVNGWCNGWAGIGLGRVGSLISSDRPRCRRDLERAIEARTVSVREGGVDNLCHGVCGRVGFLTEADNHSDGSELRSAAEHLLTRVVCRRVRTDTYRLPNAGRTGCYRPSMFLGTAGIGYQLLRVFGTEPLPCLLRFQ